MAQPKPFKDAKGNNVQKVEVDKLPLPALKHLKNQIDQELGVFQDSCHALKIAQTRYSDSRDVVNKVGVDIVTGSDILVPLTGSIYVPGTIIEAEKILIDVGTGYLINMPVKDAQDYFERKVKYVTEQKNKVQNMMVEKHRMRGIIMHIMEQRLAQLRGRQAETQSPPEVLS